jgi:Domain of Unknown Function (DUF1080)
MPLRISVIIFSVIVMCMPAGAGERAFSFESDVAGGPPKGFTAARTGAGRSGTWVVVQDAGDGRPNRVLAQTDADPTNARFPVLVADEIETRDADISVRFRPISGAVDQAAGLVWRYRDANNYYIVRANALEDNVVLYKVQNGRRSDLPLAGQGRTYGAKAPVPENTWSTLRVTVKGPRFTAYLNGEKLFEVEDTTFAAAGRIGVWTKADSVTQFDDLTIATD